VDDPPILGLMHACESWINLPRAALPALDPKMEVCVWDWEKSESWTSWAARWRGQLRVTCQIIGVGAVSGRILVRESMVG
jgi:hypothetical protein